MRALEVRQGATVRYHARFDTLPYANISFFTPRGPGGDIPFHLSLRAETGRAVCNTRAGGSWGREIGARVQFAPGGTEVEIRLTPRGAEVRLDGVLVFSLPGPLLGGSKGGLARLAARGRFAGCGDIAMFEHTGGILGADVIIGLPADSTSPAAGKIALTRRIELLARYSPPHGADAPGLWYLAAGGVMTPCETLDIRPAGARGGHVIEAAFPGRVWCDGADGAGGALRLELRGLVDGTPLARRLLDPAQLAVHIEEILAAHDLRADPYAAMQLLEHLRFSGAGRLLGPEARRAAARIAERFRLHAFLGTALDGGAGEGTSRQGELAAVAANPSLDGAEVAPADPVRAAHAAFSRKMRAEPDCDLTALLWETCAPLAKEDRIGLVLALSEVFCDAGKAEALVRAARQMELAMPEPVGAPWHDSALLPFLLLSGRAGDVAPAIGGLDGTEGWIVTPALGWTVRRALADGALGNDTREAIVLAGLDFLRREARDYWGRSACASMIEMSVALLSGGPLLPDALRASLPAALVAVHGGSRSFWDRLAMDSGGAAPELAAARAAFEALDGPEGEEMDGLRARTRRAGALRVLGRAGLVDADRLQREFLGPAGCAAPDPAPADLLGEGIDPGEAAIRHMAFPRGSGGTAGAPRLAPVAAAAMPACYPEIPQAPRAALQRRASRGCSALHARVSAGGLPPGPEEIETIADMLAALSGRDSRFIGFAMALGLFRALAAADVLDAAERLAGRIERMLTALPADDRGALRSAPALRMALAPVARIAAHAAGRADGTGLHAAGRLCDLLGLPAGGLPTLAQGQAQGRDQRHTHHAPASASPLFDTIVIVFSCRPNLDTRVEAMRGGWLKALSRLGIPYLVVVGNGDGRIEGDVLALDAPDDYEGLPQKTLAAIDWVHTQTDFAYMLKIDDDCFLEPSTFFHAQSYRKFDYYGRVLRRVQGEMDRGWHTGKSRSTRGRLELDKSPEPSLYADGGSGYTLSRDAMAAALDAARGPAGRQLVRVSFMEDKLLGDLLALRGIAPAQEDYRIAIRRRTAPGIRPVSLWVNGFDASLAAPVALVHLDGAEGQAAAMETREAPRLTPSKIWPSYQPVRLGYQSNALELVGDASKVEALRNAPVAVVACMRNEMFMLPHFLDHYRRQGVTAFAIADNLSDDGSLEYLADQEDVALFSVDTDYRLSHYGVAWQQAMLSAFRVGKWSLIADADELAIWSEEGADASLPELLAGPDFADADAARLFMLDMYPEGPLSQADFAEGPFTQAFHVDREPFLTDWPGRGPYANMPTWTSALRHRLIPGSRPDLFVAQKIALLRYHPSMRLSAGLHFAADLRLSPRELFFAHFKYNADFHRKAQAEVARRQHFNDAEEYRSYLALAAEGRERLHDPAISVPWMQCDFVRRRLG
ncbi:glycosyltransferase family 2 protein [Profundibacterium mesophilum]|uniref:Beta-13-N-acetylglucosaminyltransferase 3 n=1 Tax=Profundibacterium mesophilum KAUST100406-0324 TaxID=1037889 RepID=A0A921TC25_9RHOB|nr:glycosyltransferase family 2 protein [Profundibacterium mesophilum]KAF0674596.1 beta-13-N-acetylglucosaminyltransferase 3 [Profundibacterium mesophilum KAUST100406-0324]